MTLTVSHIITILQNFTTDSSLKTRSGNSPLAGMVFKNLNFNNIYGRRLDFSGAKFIDCSFCEADFPEARFNNATFLNVDFTRATFIQAELCGVDARQACFKGADLTFANCMNGEFSDACFAGACFVSANFRNADLRRADLCHVVLDKTDFIGANLSGVKGYRSPIDFVKENFETTPEGIIVYKIFDFHYTANLDWVIEPGSIITEVSNTNRADDCGCGINVAPKGYLPTYASKPIWKCLIRWEWAMGITVPYHSDGKIRTERLELLGMAADA